jgi:CheY-like chemotaxis protein
LRSFTAPASRAWCAAAKAEADPISGVNRTSAVLLPGGGKLAIGLLIEDNPQVRTFATDLLLDLGCEVHPVGSAEEALGSLSSFGADVVLSDIVMPGMSGIALAKQIASEQPLIPVVLATGYSEQAAQGLGGIPVVLKPYSAAELSAALKGAVGKARSRRNDTSSASSQTASLLSAPSSRRAGEVCSAPLADT